MKYKNQKIILSVIVGSLLSVSAVSAKSFNIYNALNATQSYFSVNGLTGNVGIGMTNPGEKLDMAGNIRFRSGDVLRVVDTGAQTRTIFGADVFSNPSTQFFSFIQSPDNDPNDGIQIRPYGGSVSNALVTVLNGGNVGIANNSPVYKLDVSGTSQFTQPVIVGTPTGATHAVTKSYVDGLMSSAVGSGTTGQTLRNDGVGWVANSTLFNNGTNVGIGRTNPTQKLHVEGVSATEAQFLNYEVGAPQIVFNHAGAGWGLIQNNAAGKWSLGYNGTTAFDVLGTSVLTWTNGGNVGIANTNPVYKLDITGTGQFTQPVIVGTPTATTHATTKSYVDSLLAGGSGSTVGYWTMNGTNISNSNSGNVGIGTTSPGKMLEINAGTSGHALRLTNSNTNSGIEMVTSAGTYSWLVGANNFTSNAFEIAPSTAVGGTTFTTPVLTVLQSGNVGIGTTIPNTKLDVSGGIKGISDSANAFGNEKFNTFLTYVLLGNTDDNVTNSIILLHPAYNGTLITKYFYNGKIIFNRGGAGAGNIADEYEIQTSVAYNVNIGSIKASTNTGVTPDLITCDYGGVKYLALKVDKTSTRTVAFKGELLSTLSTPTLLSESSVTNIASINAPLLSLKSSGSIGVGLANPSYKLDVLGTGQFTQPVIVGTPTGNTHATTKSYVDSLLAGGAGSTVGYWTMNGTNINNSNSGSVGIGTTNPAAPLDIRYPFSKTDTTRRAASSIYSNDAANPFGFVVTTIGAASNANRVISFQTQDMSLINGGNLVLQDSGGNVGIGTTAPGAKFVIRDSAKSSANLNNYTIFGSTDTANAFELLIGRSAGGLSNSYWHLQSVEQGVAYRNLVLQKDGGGVGIGTTAPNQALTISRSLPASGTIVPTSFLVSNGTIGSIVVGNDYPLGGFHVAPSGGNNYYLNARARQITSSVGWTGVAVGLSADVDASEGAGGQLWFYNGNIGVGATNPSYKLDVNGTGQFNQPVIVGTPTGATHATTKSYVDSLLAGGSGSTVGYWQMNGTNINNSNSGNVGIGTVGPNQKLAIVNGGTTGQLDYLFSIRKSTVADSNGSTVGMLFGTEVGDFSKGAILYERTSSYGVGRMHFALNQAGDSSLPTLLDAKMTINYNGNVGIGITNPAAKLDVAGYFQVDSDNKKIKNGDMVSFSGTMQTASDWPTCTAPARIYTLGTINASATDSSFIEIEVVGSHRGYDLSSYIERKKYVIYVGDKLTSVIEESDGQSLVGLWNGTNGGGFNNATAAGQAIQLVVNPHCGSAFTYSVNVRYSNSINFTPSSAGSRFSYVDYSGVASIPSPSLHLWNNNVGIGLINPSYKLDVSGTGNFTQPVLVGTPTANGHAVTKSYVDSLLGAGSYLPLTGGALSGGLNMGGNNITNINKLTVTTIDPLYNIKGINYSTFASAIAGGVKEEYVGKGKIAKKNSQGEYEAVIDFDNQEEGSDLWVWHKTVDFSDDNVQVLLTPSGNSAQVYYLISGNKLILRADKAVTVSYRLIGRRIDWRSWPTKATDQTEKASFIIK